MPTPLLLSVGIGRTMLLSAPAFGAAVLLMACTGAGGVTKCLTLQSRLWGGVTRMDVIAVPLLKAIPFASRLSLRHKSAVRPWDALVTGVSSALSPFHGRYAATETHIPSAYAESVVTIGIMAMYLATTLCVSITRSFLLILVALFAAVDAIYPHSRPEKTSST